ncbi:histidine phosphatase family protein [Salana multivorans]
MGASRVVLLRHGQTDYNRAGRLQGQVDIPLNEAGLEQARAAASVVAGFSPALVVSSDLGRAIETARIVADALVDDVSVVPDPRLRERAFGELRGHVRRRDPGALPHGLGGAARGGAAGRCGGRGPGGGRSPVR